MKTYVVGLKSTTTPDNPCGSGRLSIQAERYKWAPSFLSFYVGEEITAQVAVSEVAYVLSEVVYQVVDPTRPPGEESSKLEPAIMVAGQWISGDRFDEHFERKTVCGPDGRHVFDLCTYTFKVHPTKAQS